MTEQSRYQILLQSNTIPSYLEDKVNKCLDDVQGTLETIEHQVFNGETHYIMIVYFDDIVIKEPVKESGNPRIKLFSNSNTHTLEQNVNAFLKDVAYEGGSIEAIRYTISEEDHEVIQHIMVVYTE